MPVTRTSILMAQDTRRRVLAFALDYLQRSGELPTQKHMADQLNMNVNTVQKYMAELIAAGRLPDVTATHRMVITQSMRRKWERVQREIRAAYPERYGR